MKFNGTLRKLEPLGRIVLPISMRQNLDIKDRDIMEITLEGDAIVLRKHQTACVFCGSKSDIVSFESKYICRQCAAKISAL